MRLDAEQRELLGRARIGMLALDGRLPLVNPAAFHFGSDAIWMTTSRHAAKLALARRDPRAAFLVPPARTAPGVLLQGLLETYDPRSMGSGIRALLQGPAFALGLGSYALKNAAFIGGYLLDLAQIPTEWWPHNRVLLRLRADHLRLVAPLAAPAAAPRRVPGAPAPVAQAIARERSAQLCWIVSGRPVLASAAWALDGQDLLAWLPEPPPTPPREGVRTALVVEHHHPFRATRMHGLCVRGHLRIEPAAAPAIAERYPGARFEGGTAVRVEAARLTWWRGFEVRSRAVERPAALVEAVR